MSPSSVAFEPHVAIVTGAAQGIGRAIALRLASDGLDVAINDIHSKRDALDAVADEIRKKGRTALVIPGDCSQEADVQRFVDETVTVLGRLDVMVANAGVGSYGTFLGTNVSEWDKVWAINIRGVFLCCCAANGQARKRRSDNRVQDLQQFAVEGASSILGKKGNASLGAYSSSKFAVRGLTQCAAWELGEHGITVNAYAPGIIQTEMIGPVLSGPGSLAEHMRIPFAKLGKPEDIASIVSYLAKPESYFITGQSITVDGGVQFD